MEPGQSQRQPLARRINAMGLRFLSALPGNEKQCHALPAAGQKDDRNRLFGNWIRSRTVHLQRIASA